MAYMHQDRTKKLFCPGGTPTLSSIGLYEIDYVLCDECGKDSGLPWTPVWDTDSAYAARKADYERIFGRPYDQPRDVCKVCGKSC